jgi:hypothetical protein
MARKQANTRTAEELTTSAAAKTAGVTSWTICRWIRDGVIPSRGVRTTGTGRFHIKPWALKKAMGK